MNKPVFLEGAILDARLEEAYTFSELTILKHLFAEGLTAEEADRIAQLVADNCFFSDRLRSYHEFADDNSIDSIDEYYTFQRGYLSDVTFDNVAKLGGVDDSAEPVNSQMVDARIPTYTDPGISRCLHTAYETCLVEKYCYSSNHDCKQTYLRNIFDCTRQYLFHQVFTCIHDIGKSVSAIRLIENYLVKDISKSHFTVDPIPLIRSYVDAVADRDRVPYGKLKVPRFIPVLKIFDSYILGESGNHLFNSPAYAFNNSYTHFFNSARLNKASHVYDRMPNIYREFGNGILDKGGDHFKIPFALYYQRLIENRTIEEMSREYSYDTQLVLLFITVVKSALLTHIKHVINRHYLEMLGTYEWAIMQLSRCPAVASPVGISFESLVQWAYGEIEESVKFGLLQLLSRVDSTSAFEVYKTIEGILAVRHQYSIDNSIIHITIAKEICTNLKAKHPTSIAVQDSRILRSRMLQVHRREGAVHS